jgi:hypothetical protein
MIHDAVAQAQAHTHVHVVVSSFVIPIVATVLMELAETVADSTSFDWRERQIKTGWDLCVLALGSGGAIFTLPQVRTYLGDPGTIEAGALTLLVTVILALVIAIIRKRPKEKLAGWQAFAALLLGGMALSIPWYIVMHS